MKRILAPRCNLGITGVFLVSLGVLFFLGRCLAPIYDVLLGAMFMVGGFGAIFVAIQWKVGTYLNIAASIATGACIGRLFEVAVWSEQRPLIGSLAWTLNAIGVWTTFAWSIRMIKVQSVQKVFVEK